ncbi:MAG: transglycosylase domain-containing protein, partial [Oscillospiraceae bacterium]|nr:transglycosylase domain-containing protein [Oscillospiraceae bacterium]
MANRNERSKKAPRQNWQPHFLLRVINRVWRIAFSALKVVGCAVATVALIGVICAFVFAGLLGQYLQNDIIPLAEINLDNIDMEKTSYVYYFDENGNPQILQQLETTMDRRWVPYEEIPEDLIHAAVAIEDKRFYEHQGVDWITTVKACMNMFFGSSAQFGGSTLTQQLVKNILLLEDENADDVTVQRKLLEIFRALQFERTYNKEVVIEYYMNTVYFGNFCYGVKSASEYYFGKELQDMNTAELAALIGITNNPSMFNPYSQKVYSLPGQEEERDGAGRNRYRQQVVLTQMYVQGWLDNEEYLDAYGYELVYKKSIDEQDRWNTCKGETDDQGNVIQESCGYQGPVRDLIVEENKNGKIYHCPNCGSKIDISVDASKGVYSWYVDTVLEDVAKKMAAEDGVEWSSSARSHYINVICRSGYHIYTPYNAEVQAAVDNIYTNMDEIPTVKNSSKLNSAIVIIDNATGYLVAMAGDTGEKTVSDAFNHATDEGKQIGSTIKPLTVYAPAFDAGLITPATVIDDLPLYYTGAENQNPYPVNYDGTYRYQRTIWRGILNSYNTIAANTLELMGTKYSYNFAKNQLGLSGLIDGYTTNNGTVLSDVG